MAGGKILVAERWALGLGVAAGLALLVIGVRFFTVPHHAARFFGIGAPPGPFDLHHVVALRDLWVAGLLIGLALMREWRALALLLCIGALVCFGDALVVARSSGRVEAIAFHVASGAYCAGAAFVALTAVRRKFDRSAVG